MFYIINIKTDYVNALHQNKKVPEKQYNYIPTKYDRRGVLFTLYLDHNGYRQLLLSQRTIFRPEISLKSILRRQRYKPKPRTIFYF